MRVALLLLALAFSGSALADLASPTSLHIVPLETGEAAPFSGLLVPPDRYIELLEAELSSDELSAKMEVHQQSLDGMENLLTQCLESSKDQTLSDDSRVQLAAGFIVGAVTAAAVVFWTWEQLEGGG